ncbi:hypothetical protein Apa02nite_047850 [Actinoplanes palleronii]|uniref:Uncharacterized protein n=1 Tax=Actinoplanes palleronii TaxID=113570 RepID=A0ABQ4BDB7_9ACTN|nr:hypothetical protein Apa02nite_047850 [Actinoplanes palleronii]
MTAIVANGTKIPSKINFKITMSCVRRGTDRRSRRDPCGARRPLARPNRDPLRGDVRVR